MIFLGERILNSEEIEKDELESFLRLKKLMGFENAKVGTSKEVKLKNGYGIRAVWANTIVDAIDLLVFRGKSSLERKDWILHFKIGKSGTYNLTLENTRFFIGEGGFSLNEPELDKGFESGKDLRLYIDGNKHPELSLIGIKLVNWVEESIKADELKPLKFGLESPFLPK